MARDSGSRGKSRSKSHAPEAKTEPRVRAAARSPSPRQPATVERLVEDSWDGQEEDFADSLQATFGTGLRFRRIVATSSDAFEFKRRYQPAPDHPSRIIEAQFGKLRVAIRSEAILMMQSWVVERSARFTMEVQGRFLGARHADFLLIDEFVPLPSFCQSLVFEAPDPEDRQKRFGRAKVRTVAPGDWCPLPTGIGRDLAVFAELDKLSIDPFKVPIPFHSHYLKSDYQEGPSPGDYDSIYHLKWLYTPREGRSFIYSGIEAQQVEVPYLVPAIGGAHLPESDIPANPDDCELWVLDENRRFPVPQDTRGLTIGRDRSCDVVLDDPDVSRRHAQLRWTVDGALVLTDLGSRNGIRWDGAKTLRQLIQAPCSFVIGNTQLRIRF